MWKDLTLKEKAEIMRMSVANGVTDINDIQQLYDSSVGHKFDDAGRIITLADLPIEYVQKYGHINVVTPKGVRMPLSQAYRDYNQTPINANDVPGLTDYLIKQDQPDISEQAHIDKVAADRKVHQLGEERDKALIGLAAAITGGGALASGLALAPVATIGSTIGGIAGEKLFNTGYEKLTGSNWGQDVEKWTNGYIPASVGEYLNPGTLIGGIVGTKLPIPKWKNLESNGILSDWLNIKNWKLNSSPIITEENAAAVPDKMWDRAYFQAIKDENLPEVQRLRDLHFKAKSNTQILNDRGEPQIIYHGSSSKFNEYDPAKFGSATDSGWYGKGLYGSSSKNIAEDYADPYLYKFYVNSQNPYKIGFWNEEFTPYALNDYSQSSRRTHLAEFFNRTPDDLQRKLLKRWYHDDFFLDRALADMQRHDSVVKSMIGDPLKPKKIRAKYAEIVVPKPEQLKLADAITYDDTGNVIPLSKRDNFNIKDIRYSLLLPFLGMGAIASTNKFGGHIFKGGGPAWSYNPASMIEHFEGFRESPYRDGTAWSVGYGQYKNGYGANLDWDALLSGKKKLTRSEAHQQVLRTVADLKKKLKNTLGEKLYNSLTPGQLMGYLDTGYQRPASMISAAKVHKSKGAAAAASVLGVNGFADRNAARRAAFTGNWDNYTERGNKEYTPNKSTVEDYSRQILNTYEAPAFQPITLNSANVSSPWLDYISKIGQQRPVSFNTPIGTPSTTSGSIITEPISFNLPSYVSSTRPEVMENVAQLPQYQSILNSNLFTDPYLLFKNS